MAKYPMGLLRSRLLAAVGDLENISTSVDYSTIPNACDRLKARIVDAIESVTNQYGMSHHEITEQLYVHEADDDKGREWIVVSLKDDLTEFEIKLPYEQLRHWFGNLA